MNSKKKELKQTENKVEKKPTHLERIKEAGRPERYTDEYITSLIEDLLEWASMPDSIVMNEWAAKNYFSRQRMSEMAKKSPLFSDALTIAKETIGVRREKMALKGEIDAGIVKATLPTYDFEHKEMLKEMRAHDSRAIADAIVTTIQPMVFHSDKAKEINDKKKK